MARRSGWQGHGSEQMSDQIGDRLLQAILAGMQTMTDDRWQHYLHIFW